MAVIELFVDQMLAIDQAFPVTNPTGHAVLQTVTFTDLAKNYLTVADVGQTLLLGQVAEYRRSVYNLSVGQSLGLYHSGGNGPDLQVLTQFLFIGQSAKVVEYEALVQALAITQQAEIVLAKNATTTLSMTDSAACNVVRSIVVLSTLIIGSGGTGYLLDEETFSIALPAIAGPNTPEC